MNAGDSLSNCAASSSARATSPARARVHADQSDAAAYFGQFAKSHALVQRFLDDADQKHDAENAANVVAQHRGFRYKPTMSRTLLTNSGSVLNLKCSTQDKPRPREVRAP
jgi:hypothetical protein